MQTKNHQRPGSQSDEVNQRFENSQRRHPNARARRAGDDDGRDNQQSQRIRQPPSERVRLKGFPRKAIFQREAPRDGGGIDVVSAPGAGATFSVYLPVAGATGATAGNGAANPADLPRGNDASVLDTEESRVIGT